MIKHCKKCNKKVYDSSKFCADCGEVLTDFVETCMKCGIALVGGDKFCRDCGAQIGKEKKAKFNINKKLLLIIPGVIITIIIILGIIFFGSKMVASDELDSEGLAKLQQESEKQNIYARMPEHLARYENEKLLNDYTLVFEKLYQTKDPLQFSFTERDFILSLCYEIIASNIDEKYKDYISDGPADDEKGYTIQSFVMYYNTLLCANGYALYIDAVNEMLEDSINNPENVEFIFKNTIHSFGEIHSLSSGWGMSSPQPPSYMQFYMDQDPYCGDFVCDYDEFATDCIDCDIHQVWCGDPIYKCYNEGIERYPTYEYYKKLEEMKRLPAKEYIEERINMVTGLPSYVNIDGKFKIVRTNRINFCYATNNCMTQHERYNKQNQGNEIKTQIIPEDSNKIIEVRDELIKKEIEEKKEYIPFLGMNKADLIYLANYHPVSKEVLIDYSAIGINIEGSWYTFVINGGRIVSIDDGKSQSTDFDIEVSKTKLVDMMNRFNSGERASVVTEFVGLLPLKVKLNAIGKINKILKAI